MPAKESMMTSTGPGNKALMNKTQNSVIIKTFIDSLNQTRMLPTPNNYLIEEKATPKTIKANVLQDINLIEKELAIANLKKEINTENDQVGSERELKKSVTFEILTNEDAIPNQASPERTKDTVKVENEDGRRAGSVEFSIYEPTYNAQLITKFSKHNLI